MRDQNRAQVESDYVDFPSEFTVNLGELFESNALILGSRHTGKSDVAMMICERTMKEKAIAIIFDPSLDWIARSSIRQYTKVEPCTVLEAPSKSMIYDISLLSPSQQQACVESFSKRLFEHQVSSENREQYVVVFEEAHTYFPQGCMRAKALQNTVRLLSVGRNVNIACVLISQFASMLDKFAVKHSASQAWFGFTREPNDLEYVGKILGEQAKELTKLSDGEFLYLNRKGITKTQIEPYTSDIAKTEIKPSVPKILEPIKKTQSHDNGKALASVVLLLIWLGILVVALSQR